MTNSKFYTRLQARACTDKHTVVIYIRIKRGNEVVSFSTGIRCNTKEFSAKNQRLSNRTYNEAAQMQLMTTIQTLHSFTLAGKPFTLAEVKNKLLNKTKAEPDPVTFATLATQFIAYRKTQKIANSSLKSYTSIMNTMMKITQFASLSPDTITHAQCEENIEILKNYYQNKSLKIALWLLERICKRGILRGQITKNPFAKFERDSLKSNLKSKKREIPMAEEIEKHCASPGNELYAEAARFQLRTALSFIDMKNITNESVIDIKGQRCILANRQKTGVPFLIPIDNQTYEMLLNNNFHDIEYLNYLTYLKSNFNATSHSLRHLRARMMLNDGLSLEVVSRILGHSNTQTTLTYAPISGRELSKDEISKILKQRGAES